MAAIDEKSEIKELQNRIDRFLAVYDSGRTIAGLAKPIDENKQSIYHLYHWRHKPQFHVLQKILLIYPDINATWFLMGSCHQIRNVPYTSQHLKSQIDQLEREKAELKTELKRSNNTIDYITSNAK